ncbi:MAG TPA: glycosyltransferase family 87 protein [Polyangiaceae bacterium]|nr:glycosyltransferase family 87 protein [Polyangiaceae bacterium]
MFREAKTVLAEHPGWRWCWRLAAVVAVVRLLLLGAFMVDARLDVGALPGDAFYRSHSCLTAYWRASALAREGVVNLYDAALYEKHTIDGFDIDAFLYPPPFLLWPSAAAALSDRFAVVRVGWYVVELGLFVWTFASVSVWVGGRSGARCLLWLPLVVTGLPVLLGLQMGNFHVAAVVLAVIGMVAVEEDHPGWAGFCLAVATGAKVFPGILLVVLLGRRKLKPVVWTLGWLVAQTAATVVLFGTAPWKSFLRFQLPQLFAVDAAPWEAPGLFGTVNSGIFGFALKLRALGLPMGPVGASRVALLYTVALLVGAVVAGMRTARLKNAEASVAADDRRGDEDRLRAAQMWLAFLGLASLRAPFIPDAYAGAAALWLLALVACDGRRTRSPWIALAFLALWIVLPSRIAMPRIEPLRLSFTLIAQLVFLALAGGVAWRAVRARREALPSW